SAPTRLTPRFTHSVAGEAVFQTGVRGEKGSGWRKSVPEALPRSGHSSALWPGILHRLGWVAWLAGGRRGSQSVLRRGGESKDGARAGPGYQAAPQPRGPPATRLRAQRVSRLGHDLSRPIGRTLRRRAIVQAGARAIGIPPRIVTDTWS